jgi:hypothetical protein
VIGVKKRFMHLRLSQPSIRAIRFPKARSDMYIHYDQLSWDQSARSHVGAAATAPGLQINGIRTRRMEYVSLFTTSTMWRKVKTMNFVDSSWKLNHSFSATNRDTVALTRVLRLRNPLASAPWRFYHGLKISSSKIFSSE